MYNQVASGPSCSPRMRRGGSRPISAKLPDYCRPLALTRLAQRSRSHELLPKNSNNSPRQMISQNNSIVISVCNLACAARFRANAGAKSVGMVDLMPTPPAQKQPLPGRRSSLPSVKSGNICCWQNLRTAGDLRPSYSRRTRLGGLRRISPSCRSFFGSRNQISGTDILVRCACASPPRLNF
jgi:hypothetical protein